MMRAVGVLVLFLLIVPGAVSAESEGNLTLAALTVSSNSPTVGEEVTFWLKVYSTREYWDVKVGIYVDYQLVEVRDIPYIDGTQTLWFKYVFNTTGTHNVTAVVDYLNSIPETDEKDNERSVDIVVRSPPVPDLKVEKLELSSAPVFSHTPVTLNIYLVSADANAYYVPVMIFLDNRNYSLKQVPVLPENKTYVLSVSVSAGPGNHTIDVVVNYKFTIKESNYSNNYKSMSFYVYPENYTCNIRVGNVSVSDYAPRYGEEISVHTKIYNYGNVAVLDLKVAVFYDYVPVRVLTVPEIPENSSVDFVYSLVAYANDSSSNHTIGIFADYGNHYHETDERDNYKTVNITVNTTSSTLVLSPSDISLSSRTFRAGEHLTVYARIWDASSAYVSARTVIAVDNSTVLYNSTVSVAAHEYFTVYGTWLCEMGWHVIRVTVANVSVFRTIWVQPTQALVKIMNGSFNISASPLYLNQQAWLTVKVDNLGNDTAVNVGMVFMYTHNNVSDIFCFRNITVLAHAMSFISVPWTPESTGNYTLTVAFLPNESVNYLNFNSTLNVSVLRALPNIKVWKLAYTLHGNRAEFRVYMNNTGVIAARDFVVAISDNGRLLNKTYVTIFPAGSSRVLTLNATLSQGHNVITAVADYDNSVREYNESDNNYTVVINIPYNSTSLYVILATVGVVVAVLALAMFFVYSVRAFFANLFYEAVLSAISLILFLREKPPFSGIIASFKRWEQER